jgi:hypothetical protein
MDHSPSERSLGLESSASQVACKRQPIIQSLKRNPAPYRHGARNRIYVSPAIANRPRSLREPPVPSRGSRSSPSSRRNRVSKPSCSAVHPRASSRSAEPRHRVPAKPRRCGGCQRFLMTRAWSLGTARICNFLKTFGSKSGSASTCPCASHRQSDCPTAPPRCKHRFRSRGRFRLSPTIPAAHVYATSIRIIHRSSLRELPLAGLRTRSCTAPEGPAAARWWPGAG